MCDEDAMGKGATGYTWVAVMLACIVCMAFFSGAMWQRSHEKTQPVQIALAASEDARATEQKQADTTQVAVKKTAEAAVHIHQQTQKVVSYVPYVITPDVVSHFPLSNGFVRVVDAAISGEADSLATGTGEPDDAASTVAPDEGATILSQDFGVCREAIDRNTQWQAWAIAAGLAPKPEQGAE